MTITLRPEQEKLIAQAMKTGAYQDAGEVIERALEMLRAKDEWRHLAEGLDDLKRGRTHGPYSSAKEAIAALEARVLQPNSSRFSSSRR